MIKNILAVLVLVIVAIGGALIIQKGGQNFSQIPTSSQLAQVATDGLVGYWSFDNETTAGKIGNAKSFSGSSFNTGSDPIKSSAATACAWINPTSQSAYTPTIFSNGMFTVSMYGQSPFTLSTSNNRGSNNVTTSGVSSGSWNHICVTRDSAGTSNIYINGALKATGNAGAVNAGYNSLIIGNTQEANQGFNGLIDEARVYSRVLSASEISAIASYSGGTVTPPPASTYTLTVTKNGGTISSSPAGLDCAGGNVCTQTVNAGSQVILTATPPTGTTITWSGACSGSSPTCNVTVNTNTSVTASFGKTGVTLDTTSPVISNVSTSGLTAGTRGANATISWTTDEQSDSYIQYGPTTSYSGHSTLDSTLTTSHSQQLSGLANDTVYHYVVQSKDASGNLATSPDKTFTTPAVSMNPDITPPTAPTITARAVSSSQIDLSWGASTDPVTGGETTSGVSGYNIYRNGTKLTTVTGTSYSNTGLTASTAYSYTVSAYDGAGNQSAQSAAVSATTLANPVTGKFSIGQKVQVGTTIAVRSTPTSVNSSNKIGTQSVGMTGTVATGSGYSNPTSADGLIWWYINYDSSPAMSGWSTESYLSAYTAPVTYSLTITKSGTGIGTVTATCGTTTCPTAIPAGTTVKLTATPSTTLPTTAGSSFSLWSGISGCATASTCTFTMSVNTSVTAVFTQNTQTTDNPPTAPSNLAATVISATQINLTWTPSTDDHGINGYYVYRDGSNIANVTTGLTGTTVAFNNTTLSAGTTYTYTVAAYDTIGQIGAQSASVTKTTTAAPTLTITATAGTNGTISPSGAVSVASGGSQRFDITPNSGYTIATVVVDGVSMTAGSPYTFTNVTANHTINATFSTVVSNTPTATLTANPSNIATAGSPVTLTWSSTNAVSCIGTGFSTGNAVSGSVTVNPASNTNYTVTCGTASQSANVTIGTITSPLPTDRQINWSNAGVPGGIPSANWAICKTLSPSGGDDTAAIQNALDTCGNTTNTPSQGKVVFLNPGTFKVTKFNYTSGSSGVDTIIKNNVVLRGSGPDKTTIKLSGAYTGGGALQFGYSIDYPAFKNVPRFSISSGASRGSTSIVVGGTVDSSMVGDIMHVSQVNTTISGATAPSVSQKITGIGAEGTGPDPVSDIDRSGNTRNMNQIVKITGVSGNTVTFTPPLYVSYTNQPQAAIVTKTTHQLGIEDLKIDNSSASMTNYATAYASTAFWLVDQCWIKNVESTNARNHFYIYGSYNCEIRDSYFHNPVGNVFQDGSDNGYNQMIISSASLIENNIFTYALAPMILAGASGNVMSYNYFSNIHGSDITNIISSLNFNHGAHDMFNLAEGNIANLLHSDNYYGSGSHGVVYRNYFTGNDTGVLYRQKPISIDNNNYYFSVIGNVLGSSGIASWKYQATEADKSCSTCTLPPTIYRLGYAGLGHDGAGNLDSNVKTTLLRGGNYDYSTKSVVWSNNAPDSANYLSSQSLPASLYRTSAPSEFSYTGTPFPPIGPDVTGGTADASGHANNIPAKKCYSSIPTTGFNGKTCYGN